MIDLTHSRNLAVRSLGNCHFAILMLFFLLAARGTAQTFTTLHRFTGGSDGAFPFARLILSGNTLYGVEGSETVFKVNTDGTGFTVLNGTGGVEPDFNGGLTLSGNKLYGTAVYGGPWSSGTVFKLNIDGTGFTNLYTFTLRDSSNGTNKDGATPKGDLTLSSETLYGTTEDGGSGNAGTVFKVNTDGTGFTNLHSFGGSDGNGGQSEAGLLLSGNTLYGTTISTVFAVNTDGTGFKDLHIFGGSDGNSLYGGLILSSNVLYGAAALGGSSGNGTAFKLNTDGTGFKVLHDFTDINPLTLTNSDGANPFGRLVLTNNTLYGTAESGGSSGNGTLFAVSTDGTGFTTLYSFTALIPIYTNSQYEYVIGTNSNGAHPVAGLTLSRNTLYGTARDGGIWGTEPGPRGGPLDFGTVFSISFTPQLSIIPSGANVILSWPTNCAGFDYTGYTLQSTTNLGSSAAWTTNSPAPVVVNGQNTVTSPISGTQRFYRLSR